MSVRSNFLHKCHDYVSTQTRKFFRSVGSGIGKSPWKYILSSLFVACALSTCILAGKWEIRLEYRDALRSSESFKIFDGIMMQTFGSVPRVADMIIELSDNGDGDNILEKTKILEALAIHEQVLELSTSNTLNGNAPVNFQDVCLKLYENGPCNYDSPFVRLGITSDDIESMSQDEIDKKFSSAAFSPELSLNYVVGGLEVTEDPSSGEVKVKAKSLRFMHYTVLPTENSSKKIYDLITGGGKSKEENDVLEWESAFLDFTCSTKKCPPRDDGLVIIAVAERGLTDELNRNATSSTPYMVAAVNFIMVIMWFMLGGIPFRYSRLSLGVGAVNIILLSMVAGFGIISILQIPLTDLSLLLVFVVVGIGVDDVIVVVDFVKCQVSELPLEDRIANGLEKAGPCIFLTSLTNLIAFFVASIIDYPGVQWFCSAAGVILFILFIFTVTLFTGLLTLDERRVKKKKYDCLCCVSYDSLSNEDRQGQEEVVQEEDSRKSSLGQTLQKAYLPFISNKIISTLIVVGFLSLIPIGFGFAVSNLAVGAKFENYFPDGSYYILFTDTAQKNFVSLGTQGNLILQSIDASDPNVQDQVKSVISDLEEEDFLIKPHASWLADYEAYAYEHNNNADRNNTLPISGEGYYEALQDYLQITDRQCADRRESGECNRYVIPASYARDIVFSKNSNVIESISVTRLNCMIRAYETSAEQIKFMDEHRDALTTSLKSNDLLSMEKAKVYSRLYLFFDRDKKMNTLIAKTLVFAALAVLGTLLFFFHPISVLIIALAIASIDGALFTVMYIWDIPIDVVAFLVLAMSIGLSVDYVVHVAHAFEQERGVPRLRLQNALSGIGFSVAKGGMSTFVGIVPLAFAPSKVFRTFFQLIFSTVILGLFAGLVFFPACAILIGPFIRSKHTERK